ncbi:uncharacterized protein [Nicotiana sylvestris]|uniref:uncharacterized protein n=1 Tax=Nicotiana sylvestris TaxID=4096 RepID=UPI00388C440F
MASDFMDRFRFNIENALDVFYIQNLKKKTTEMTFREYSTRLRSEAAKVRPSLDEEQMYKFFVRAHDPQYYERLMVIENHKFSDIIKLGERIEEVIKSRTVTKIEALQAINKALQSATVHHTYNSQPSNFQSPPARQNYPRPRPNFDRKPPRQYIAIAEPIDHLYERLKVAGYVTHVPAVALENPSQWVNPNKTCAYHSGIKGHTTTECRTLKDKIQTLIDNKFIQAKEAAPNVRNNLLPDHRGDGVHMIETNEEWDPEGSIGLIREGNDIKVAVILTPIVVQIQAPIDVEVTASVPFEVEVAPPVAISAPFEVEVVTPFTVTVSTTSPFNSKAIPWDYVAEARRKGKAKVQESDAAQGMTRARRVYTPEHLGGSSKEATTRQPVIETGPDDLCRKVQAKEYSIVNHLNKVPAQISILSLS